MDDLSGDMVFVVNISVNTLKCFDFQFFFAKYWFYKSATLRRSLRKIMRSLIFFALFKKQSMSDAKRYLILVFFLKQSSPMWKSNLCELDFLKKLRKKMANCELSQNSMKLNIFSQFQETAAVFPLDMKSFTKPL